MKINIFIITFCLVLFGLIILFNNENNNNIDNTIQDIDYMDNNNIIITTDSSNDIDNYVNMYNNNEVVGEISILNTDYKKAIMQHSDNKYYLDHLEDNQDSYMGSIYLDFRNDINTSNKLLIYGHNSKTINMPFKILEGYYEYDYYKEHMYIQVKTRNKVRLYIIYSVYVEPSDYSYMKTDFNNQDEWYLHIKSFKDKSLYDTFVDVDNNDNILILQTCSYYYKYANYDKKYLLVIAKEIK